MTCVKDGLEHPFSEGQRPRVILVDGNRRGRRGRAAHVLGLDLIHVVGGCRPLGPAVTIMAVGPIRTGHLVGEKMAGWAWDWCCMACGWCREKPVGASSGPSDSVATLESLPRPLIPLLLFLWMSSRYSSISRSSVEMCSMSAPCSLVLKSKMLCLWKLF